MCWIIIESAKSLAFQNKNFKFQTFFHGPLKIRVVYKYPINRIWCWQYTLFYLYVLVYNSSSWGVHNPRGICKLEGWSSGIPFVCVCLYYLYNNFKLHFCCCWWSYCFLFSKFSYFNTTSKQVFFLAQSNFKNLFIRHFLIKPPHFLKILAEIRSYLLHNFFKSQSCSWT